MKISKKGLDLIKKYEGFRNAPYYCPAGIPTIGFGSTYYEDGSMVKITDEPITRARAIEILKTKLIYFEEVVLQMVKSKINQNQFDALVSFVYNLGEGNFEISTLLKKVNALPKDEDIRSEFHRWNKARVNGRLKPLKGLTKRRNEEAYLYFTPIE